MTLPTTLGARSTYVLAIVGSTGRLGLETSTILAKEPYVNHFSEIRFLTRDVSAPKAKELAALGGPGKVLAFDPYDEKSVDAAFAGADIVLSVLTTYFDHKIKDAIVAGLERHKVRVYIPSEFGLDHRPDGLGSQLFSGKSAHAKKAAAVNGGNIKVVSIYNGLFIDSSFVPFFGFDTENGVYTSVACPDTLAAWTSVRDIALSTARTILLAASPSTAPTLPDGLRIAGDLKSINQVAEIAGRNLGKKIHVKNIPEEGFETVIDGKENLVALLGLSVGKGLADHTKNDNDVVNPGEQFWKWGTVEDYFKGVASKA